MEEIGGRIYQRLLEYEGAEKKEEEGNSRFLKSLHNILIVMISN